MSTSVKQKVKSYNNALQYCKLSQTPVPADCSEDERQEVRELVKNAYLLPAGEKLCSSGNTLKNLYAVLSGSVKNSITGINGNAVITDFYLPGEIIGLDAISTRRHSFDAITLEESMICVIPFEKLLALAAKIPPLQQHFTYIISQKLLDRTYLLINNHHTAEQRVAAFIMNIIYRYQYSGSFSDSYHLSMSRYDIGNYLNLTPETISRTFTKFQNSGILAVQKKCIQLLDTSQLEEKC